MSHEDFDLEDRLRRLAERTEQVVMPTGPVVRDIAAVRRHRRRQLELGFAVLVIAAAVVAGLSLWPASRTIVPASNGGGTNVTSSTAATTTTTNQPSTTTTPTTAPSNSEVAATALNAYVAQQTAIAQREATTDGQTSPVVSVHSPPVSDNGSLVAVAAFSYSSTGNPVQILTYGMGYWTSVATLGPDLGPPVQPQPDLFELVAGAPVSVADVTGDGRPDFLILLQAADNTPGVVVSQQGATWRYVPNSGLYATSDVLSRSPEFLDGKLVSTYDACVPNCASGHSEQITWTYDPTTGEFTTPTAPGGT